MSKSMDWFLYYRYLRYERVRGSTSLMLSIIMKMIDEVMARAIYCQKTFLNKQKYINVCFFVNDFPEFTINYESQ